MYEAKRLRLAGLPLWVGLMLLSMSGCTLPNRPASLDSPGYPVVPAFAVPTENLPNVTLTQTKFPRPVIAEGSDKTVDAVTITAAQGPYNDLKPFTQKWMAESGVYLFRVTLTNSSSQSAELGSMNVRLVVGEERVVPIGIADRAGGDTSVASGSASMSRYQAQHAAWRAANGLDSATISAVYAKAIEDFFNTEVLTKKGRRSFSRCTPMSIKRRNRLRGIAAAGGLQRQPIGQIWRTHKSKLNLTIRRGVAGTKAHGRTKDILDPIDNCSNDLPFAHRYGQTHRFICQNQRRKPALGVRSA